MEVCGVPLQSSQEVLVIDFLFDDLAAQDKRMLLMLDEFESVYKVREGSLDQVAARCHPGNGGCSGSRRPWTRGHRALWLCAPSSQT